jgi:hypothetical protein
VLVAKYPLGSRFHKYRRSCGGSCCKRGPTHGPYWFARAPQINGKRGKSVYVGGDGKKREIELAWELVSAELAALQTIAEATPVLRQLRELQAIAGVKKSIPRAPAGVVDVPILSLGGRTDPPK